VFAGEIPCPASGYDVPYKVFPVLFARAQVVRGVSQLVDLVSHVFDLSTLEEFYRHRRLCGVLIRVHWREVVFGREAYSTRPCTRNPPPLVIIVANLKNLALGERK
jgi:hypothetical protein